MFKDLLEVAKKGEMFTDKQWAALKKLKKNEQEEIFKAKEKAFEQKFNKVINKEFKRVYKKLKRKNPEIAEGLSKIANVSDDNFMEKYHDDKNYSLNEVMIAVLRDDETPEDVKDQVRTKIYTKNIGLIGSQLKRFSTKNDGKMTMEDLAQDCKIIFFQKAVDKFDLSRGAKFSTFATTVIHNYLAGIYTNKINKARAIEISLSTPVADDTGSVKTLEDYQIDPTPNPEEKVMQESANKIIYDVLNKLTLEQKFVAYCRYGLGGVPKKTQAEIADYMHMSQANVSKIEGTMRTRMMELLGKAGMF